MTEKQIEKETESYGADLCAYCRECEGEKPCHHKKDAMYGYKDGLKDGYYECQKEHEWHYVKNGDLPKRDKDFVVDVSIPVLTHPNYVFARYYSDNKKWFSFGEEIEVIAWKEIVLPELPKEIE